jgi:hypothetical protein
MEVHERDITAAPRTVNRKPPDYTSLRPLFGWLPVDIIKKTFEVTTQYARLPMSTHLKKAFRSPFPAANVHRRNEPVATDKIVSDTPAIYSGATDAQVFVGTETLLTDVYGIQSDKEFPSVFQDNIRRRGAPTKLISDSAINTRIHRNAASRLLRLPLTQLWTALVHHPSAGSFASYT